MLTTSAAFAHDSEEVALCAEELGSEGFLARPFPMLEVPNLLHEVVTSGWSVDEIDDPVTTLHDQPWRSTPSQSDSRSEERAVGLGELRQRQREASRARSLQPMDSISGASLRASDPCRASVRDLRRELAGLRLAPPRRVLGLGPQARRNDIRFAALRKSRRLERLRDDVHLVPEVRVAAQALLELVRTAEACLLGRLV